MNCPNCKKTMSKCVNGNDEGDAIYFNNCPYCNIQIDDDGYVLAFEGNKTIRSNYKLKLE